MASLAIYSMQDLLPQILHLTPQEYETKPWKNGKGKTHDIFMFPKGADHSSFDLRFALSPIIEKGVFSSFPGADRVITVIEGEGLNLEFEDKTVNLQSFESLSFDTGLAPIGDPIGGFVRVVNVMARRNVWKIERCEIMAEVDVSCEQGEIMFVFAINGDWLASTVETKTDLKQGGSLFISKRSSLKVNSLSGGQVLFAHLKPVDC